MRSEEKQSNYYITSAPRIVAYEPALKSPTLTSVVLALTVKSFPRDKANLKAQAKYATFKGVCQIPNMTFEIKLGKEEKKNQE